MIKLNRHNVFQFGKFILIGGLNTAVDFAMLNMLVYAFGADTTGRYAVWKTLAFAVAMCNSYLLNRRYTFGGAPKNARTVSAFVIITVATFLINVGISSLVFFVATVEGELGNELAANIGALSGTAVSTVLNFVGYKLFVFKA